MLMSAQEIRGCDLRGKQGRLATRQAWIDQDGKLISFHPIDSGQLLEDKEPLFWEKVITLSRTGYRIQ